MNDTRPGLDPGPPWIYEGLDFRECRSSITSSLLRFLRRTVLLETVGFSFWSWVCSGYRLGPTMNEGGSVFGRWSDTKGPQCRDL